MTLGLSAPVFEPIGGGDEVWSHKVAKRLQVSVA